MFSVPYDHFNDFGSFLASRPKIQDLFEFPTLLKIFAIENPKMNVHFAVKMIISCETGRIRVLTGFAKPFTLDLRIWNENMDDNRPFLSLKMLLECNVLLGLKH